MDNIEKTTLIEPDSTVENVENLADLDINNIVQKDLVQPEKKKRGRPRKNQSGEQVIIKTGESGSVSDLEIDKMDLKPLIAEAVKVVPFELIAGVTGYDGFNLTDKEANVFAMLIDALLTKLAPKLSEEGKIIGIGCITALGIVQMKVKGYSEFKKAKKAALNNEVKTQS
jgi:hypothetical protein